MTVPPLIYSCFLDCSACSGTIRSFSLQPEFIAPCCVRNANTIFSFVIIGIGRVGLLWRGGCRSMWSKMCDKTCFVFFAPQSRLKDSWTRLLKTRNALCEIKKNAFVSGKRDTLRIALRLTVSAHFQQFLSPDPPKHRLELIVLQM